MRKENKKEKRRKGERNEERVTRNRKEGENEKWE
jgi:hypothetical protein